MEPPWNGHTFAVVNEDSIPVPIGLDGGRHRDLAGRRDPAWGRRAVISALSAIVVFALLNGFGQCTSLTVVRSPSATLTVDGPASVRGGLVFTSEIVVSATQPLANARIFLARGWFQGMSVNTIEPAPTAESSDGAWLIVRAGRIRTGHPYHLWLSLQTNPTNVGGHRQDVALYDGNVPVATARRSLFVFP
jgi:hypothetical protein